jgi:hypothetical protein
LRRGGFPYNLMKSQNWVVNEVPLLFLSPPFALINDTKVRGIVSVAKDKKKRLLKGLFVKFL